MPALTRQNTLFVAEDWVRIYEALENVDFRAYDFDNLVQALFRYLQANYPEQINDWVASSEFVTKVEILAWLSQNIAFRVDLNSRENFLATAERRDSLIRLAQNIGYKMNRVRSANGNLKMTTIRTTQDIVDSNGVNLRNKTITWNDPRDEDWFERFILILNSAFATRTQFGFPLAQNTTDGLRVDQYTFNSAAPATGSYRFSASVNGVNTAFDMFNGQLEASTGVINELAPNPSNAFNLFYYLDGRGFGSTQTGFFVPFKQGNLSFQDQFFTDPQVLRTFDLSATNVNNNDFFVQQIDEVGAVQADWEQVDTTFGEGVSFNTFSGTSQNVYEVDTLVNDQARVRFGDGSFGRIPVGRFRFWYRTATPTPTPIAPTAIQNQLLTIPYVDDDQRYQLTMTFSLQTTVTNGVQTESNFDIRTRAGKVFYTQNRMVNAQDYNNFFLKDSSIQKVKTVNRTFSGQSRYARLNDPTSLYQNVKHVAEDGRLYQDTTTTIQTQSADTSVLSVDALISQYVKPIFRKADKEILYFNAYSEIIFSNQYQWTETSQIANQSRGNVTQSSIAQIVGDTGTGNLQYINTNAILRLEDPLGTTVTIDQVVEDGTASDGVILRSVIPNNSNLFSVLPAYRNSITATEENELSTRLVSKLDFAMSWNQATLSWDFINSDNINRTGSFALTNQGDTTGAGLDASWMVLFEFQPNSPTDQWQITDRGSSLFFESAREIDFVFSNTSGVVNPETGRVEQDTIDLLESNESRDSLRRRGLDGLGQDACELAAFTFTGDGTSTDFQTPQVPLLEEFTVVLVDGVLQVLSVDYTIVADSSGYIIRFTTAPANGAALSVYFSSRFRNATISTSNFTGDGTTDEFDLGVADVQTGNVIVFIDGVAQNSSLDYGIGTIGTNASLVFFETPPVSTSIVAYTLSGIGNTVFTKSNYVGDGADTTFVIPTQNQTSDTILVSLDGVIQAPSQYSITANTNSSNVVFATAPATDTRIRIISATNPTQTRTNQYEYAGDGATAVFTLTGLASVDSDGDGLIVTIDGIQQDGPWAAVPEYSVANNNEIVFTTPPPAATTVQVFYISGSLGVDANTDITVTATTNLNITEAPLDVESCLVHFLGETVTFTPNDVIRHADGYVNKNGVAVSPNDADSDGTFDNPFIFKDLVIQDGTTDLVLWRKVQEFGFNVYDPINANTSPRGTYGSSAQGSIATGDAIDTTTQSVDDIHYDTFTSTWLIADTTTSTWIAATDQSQYKFLTGRDNLRFIWTHYAPESNRIDPSKSNIMNVYMLTTGYDSAYRSWLSRNGDAADEPTAETSEQLRIQYSDFEDFKPISDAIIYYPARYKPLFGSQAISELQATFKIIQTPGSTLSESDLKLRVLSAIDTYFDVDRWEFGDQFYYTELVAFVHAELAPDLQSMVIVPTTSTQAFGRMFQVRAEPDELFISAASPTDIEVVEYFTDDELRIGTLT